MSVETVTGTDEALIVELVNSRAHGGRPDRLDSLPGIAGVPAATGVPAAIRTIRDVLLEIALSDGDTQPMWDRLTDLVSDTSLRYSFSDSGVSLVKTGGEPHVANVAQAVARLVQDGVWSRMRICANEECSTAYFDHSRSRTQKWHSYEVCGNRVNVAAHRSRSAKSSASS